MRGRGDDFGISGSAGVSREPVHGDEDRALVHGQGFVLRLRVWRGNSLVVDRGGSGARAIDREMALLYEHEAPRLKRRLARRASPEKAGDLVQSAFLRLLGLGPERLAHIDQPRAYLNRIADNLAKDDNKSAVRRCESLHLDIATCATAAPDPLAALEARDMLRRIEAAITRLPDRTREIFMAHRFEDLTYNEIADRLGLSVKTVEKHISLALRELHGSLDTAP